MKIISWNVNGIRACHRKGAFYSLLEEQKPDILGIQETKAWPEQLSEDLLHEHGYHAVWGCAEKKGYSGTATFSRVEPDDVQIGMGVEEFDREGRVLITRYNQLTFFNAYFPNGQRDHARLPYKTRFYRAALAWGVEESSRGQKVVMSGDFNTAHHEIDLKNYKQNRKTSGFTEPERALLDEYVEAGFTDSFRHQNPDRGDVYTWWSNRAGVRERNIGWRIDYHFLNQAAMKTLVSTHVLSDHLGSDHCPVSVVLAS